MQRHAAAGIPPEEARRRRLLHVAFVTVLAITTAVGIGSLLPWRLPWNERTALITVTVGIVYAVGLVALRRGHVAWASRLLVLGVVLGSWLPASIPGAIGGARSYAFTATNVLIAAYVLSARAGIAVAAIDVFALTALWRLRPDYTGAQLAEDVFLLAVFSTILVTVAWQGERDRAAIRHGRATLQTSLEAQTALMDGSPDAIVAVGPDDRIVAANRVAVRWASEHFHVHITPGASIHATVPPALCNEMGDLLAEARRCGSVRSESMWGDEESPNWFQCLLQATPQGLVTVQVRDVSDERRASMRERAAYRDRVELEKLRDMDRFRIRLLNTASHELRTPITPLRLQLSILEHRLAEGSLDAAGNSITILRRNIDRLAVLVDDLLDVARLESGDMRIERHPIELDSFLAREMEGYDAVAAEVGATLHLDARSGARVEADPARLAQVLTNLLTNALKYVGTGGRIDVTARQRDGVAVVEVRDDGAGFAPAQSPLLFQPFSQLHEGKERRDGTGLGLFICKGIVERHGGTVWGRSGGPGQGATFGFHLPVRATLKDKVPTLVQP